MNGRRTHRLGAAILFGSSLIWMSSRRFAAAGAKGGPSQTTFPARLPRAYDPANSGARAGEASMRSRIRVGLAMCGALALAALQSSGANGASAPVGVDA